MTKKPILLLGILLWSMNACSSPQQVASRLPATATPPPWQLPDQLGGYDTGKTDGNDFFPPPKASEGIGDLLSKRDLKSSDGLENVRVFVGGPDSAKYFFSRLYQAAKNEYGGSNITVFPNFADAWNS